MPSTKMLASRIRGNIAKFLYTFCGIASFGVVTMLVVAGATTTASATGNAVNSNTVSANVQGVIAIRLLDSTATTEISELNFNLTPTSSGTSATQRAVVDVSTSNPTGYKLYMQSNYQTKDSQGEPTGTYTTNLTHTDTGVSDVIPTYVPGSGSGSGTNTLYWNYTNPMTSTNRVIPSHSGPADQLDQYFNTTNSRQTPVDINVSVDTTIVSGTYENELLFSAVANPTTSTYTLEFNTDGGSMVGEDIVETATAWTHSIEIPNNSDYTPTKSGYTFDHWLDEDTSTTYYPGDSVTITSDESFTGSVTLKAVYTASSLLEVCNTANIGDIFTYNDTTYIKLKTNSEGTTGACYTQSNQGSATWANARNVCPSGTIVPSREDYDNLINVYGGIELQFAAGWAGSNYWTSTINGASGAIAFWTRSNQGAYTYGDSQGASLDVLCRVGETIATATYMQEVGYCPDTLTEGTQYTLTDRGETSKTYTTSKLADGKCWMTQNYNRSAGALNTNDYNVSSGGFTIANSDCATASWAGRDNTNHYCNNSTYGGYYSYYTASASSNPSTGTATNDICPKGWRLPAPNEFNDIITGYSAAQSGSNLTYDPVKMTFGGYCEWGGCPVSNSSGYGIMGWYWSSSAIDSTYATFLNFSSTSANTTDTYKGFGMLVRCVFSS